MSRIRLQTKGPYRRFEVIAINILKDILVEKWMKRVFHERSKKEISHRSAWN